MFLDTVIVDNWHENRYKGEMKTALMIKFLKGFDKSIFNGISRSRPVGEESKLPYLCGKLQLYIRP